MTIWPQASLHYHFIFPKIMNVLVKFIKINMAYFTIKRFSSHKAELFQNKTSATEIPYMYSGFRVQRSIVIILIKCSKDDT